MSKFFRNSSKVLCVFLLIIMLLVGFYGAELPDSYLISKGEKLMINSLFSISAKPCETKVREAFTDQKIVRDKNSETLMLFGTVPIKDVTSKKVERPMLYPCGQPFGIKLITDGVMVIDLTKIGKRCPARECGIKEGDIIISVNDKKVTSNSDLSKIISDSKGENCSVTLKRNNETISTSLSPVFYDGGYKAGMWVRDSSAGIGTLTFFDEETKSFGGLGHPICDSDTKEMLPLSEGIAGEVKITGCNRSENGKPGQLLGEFASSAAMGTILSNCTNGIFGTLVQNPSEHDAVELGFRQEIHKGKAKILSTIDDDGVKEYDIVIDQINMKENAEHDLVIKVTDKDLIDKTGGIVQGMSGSPIIQDGKLVGAVTHVFIEDPQMGYGIFADSMYERSSSLSDNNVGLAG